MKKSYLLAVGGVIGLGISITTGVMRAAGGSVLPAASRAVGTLPVVQGLPIARLREQPAPTKMIPSDPAKGFQALVADYRVMGEGELEDNRKRVQGEIDSRELIEKANRAQLNAVEAQDLAALLQKSDAIAVVRTQRLMQNLE